MGPPLLKPMLYQLRHPAWILSIMFVKPSNFFQVHFGADPESFHIIGHSLGAHIAGYVGERLLAIEAEGRGGGGKLGDQLLHIFVLTPYLWIPN